ncbi:hypothetical protein SAMN04487943_1221, partial [Gracilibacillus orientalis]
LIPPLCLSWLKTLYHEELIMTFLFTQLYGLNQQAQKVEHWSVQMSKIIVPPSLFLTDQKSIQLSYLT